MQIFESRNGQHWEDTHQYRPLNRMTSGDGVWFVMGHIMLAPLALAVLALTALCLPLYWLWARRRNQYPHEIETHGEVLRIMEDAPANREFAEGAKLESKPNVSVVIPFYNRAEWVDWAVGSVLAQSLPDWMTIELIAVDNGSTDGTVQALERHPVRLIHCARRGPGAARNAGIEAARGEIIAFTDSDCVVDRYWVRNLIEAFEDPDLLIAGGKILSMEKDDFVATFTNEERLLDNEKFFAGSGYFPPFFATANAAYRRDALVKVGGFDDTLWMSEDADLSWRVLDLGGRMAYMEDAVVYHRHRTTMSGFFHQAIDYGAASVAIFAKHQARLEANAAFSWKNLRDIAWSPFQALWDQFTAETAFDRQRELLYALWRLGFTYGSVRECFRRRVFFL